ncbi:MAG: aspartate-semialdehyde dehydrogenase [Ignavibacteriales bacterium]|nr:aspartate-semialdehyde dehydrogenase [Ignavibacteriales bacterium]
MKLHDVAIVGATGLVGRTMVQVLMERQFPINRLVLLASERSVGKELNFNGTGVPVHALSPEKFKHCEYVLFSAGATVSKEFAPLAVRAGAVVIDNSSAFRMEDNVPLVVPEVNRKQIFKHKGIIANPNCSTIQLVVALKPLHDRFRIKRVVVSTYQSVTGAGKKGVDQLADEIAGREPAQHTFPHRIAWNALPHIDLFFDDGYSREEHKMMNETSKIMGERIRLTATCVRIPVTGGHSESVNIEFEKKCSVADVREILQQAPGVVVLDDPKSGVYPMPLNAAGKDEVFVGRIRKDETVTHGVNLWIVADNIRKGAATNAVQIAEALALGK